MRPQTPTVEVFIAWPEGGSDIWLIQTWPNRSPIHIDLDTDQIDDLIIRLMQAKIEANRRIDEYVRYCEEADKEQEESYVLGPDSRD